MSRAETNVEPPSHGKLDSSIYESTKETSRKNERISIGNEEMVISSLIKNLDEDLAPLLGEPEQKESVAECCQVRKSGYRTRLSEKAAKKNLNENNQQPASEPEISAEDSEHETADKDRTKRIWNRRDCCLYCKKMITNFTRHLKRNHGKELEVSKVLAYPKGSKERKLLFEKLKRKGNFYKYANNLSKNSGNFVEVRQSKKGTDPSNFLPCKYCFGFISFNRIYRHLKECKLRQFEETPNATPLTNRTQLQLEPPNATPLTNRTQLQLEPPNATPLINRTQLQIEPQNATRLRNRTQLQLEPQDATPLTNKTQIKLEPQNATPLTNGAQLQLEIPNATPLTNNVQSQTETSTNASSLTNSAQSFDSEKNVLTDQVHQLLERLTRQEEINKSILARLKKLENIIYNGATTGKNDGE